MNKVEFWEKFKGFKVESEETPIEEGFLLREYQERFKLSSHKSKVNIKAMIDEGLIEPCTIKRKTVHGTLFRRPGYRWIGE